MWLIKSSCVPGGCVTSHKKPIVCRYIKTRRARPFHARQCKTKGQACEDMGQMRVLANLCAMRIHNKAPATVRVHEMFVKIPCGQTPGQNPASFSATACAPCPNSVHTGIACHSVRTVTELDSTNSDLLFGWQLFIYPPFLFIRCIKTHTHTNDSY